MTMYLIGQSWKVSELAKIDKKQAIKRLEKYLKKEWYRGHSEYPWYNDHKYGIIHDGYWSFESGALVNVLGLDDSGLKGLPYYPYDMVHWNDTKIKKSMSYSVCAYLTDADKVKSVLWGLRHCDAEPPNGSIEAGT